MLPTSALRLGSKLLLVWLPWAVLAAEVDPAKLPPPANRAVDFLRDVQPILTNSCLRCHGPERPKSQFRLDGREVSLKGGDNGIAIVPGKSAESRLIHFVARLVPDMEMPPDGKGDPLTPEQVGLLRAWIDQGANWSTLTNTGPQLNYQAVPGFRFLAVEGARQKFREVEGIREGVTTGLESFAIEGWANPEWRVGLTGRALFGEDHQEVRAALTLEKQGLGFFRAGFQQWTRYYDDSGGHDRLLPLDEYELPRDLGLDLGRAWIDLGLARPGWPTVVLGYEYRFRDGTKSILEWGPVGDRNVYPAFAIIDERTHILKLDVAHEAGPWRLEDRARLEWHSGRDERWQATSVTPSSVVVGSVRTGQGTDHVQGMNSLRIERRVGEWWLLSAGYFYSRLAADSSFTQATYDVAGNPAPGQFWSSESDGLELAREVHLFSLASQWLPLKGLALWAGAQSQWTRQEGLGALHLDEGDPEVPELFLLRPVSVRSDMDSLKWIEDLGVRYSRIPFTVLSVDGRFEQESLSQFEAQAGEVAEAFLRETDATQRRWEVRPGFTISPWPWVSLQAHYARRFSESDYDHVHRFVLEGDGYSAFIRHRLIESDGVRARLSLRPLNWLRVALSYRRSATDFSTETDPLPGNLNPGGMFEAGKSGSDVYGASASATLFRNLQVSGAFTWTDSRLRTARNGVAAVVPYDGRIMSLLAGMNYHLKGFGRIEGAYTLSDGYYGQDHYGAGLPLGLNFTRHGVMLGVVRGISKAVTASLRYRYYEYSEPGSGGGNDYTAHGVFGTVALAWK